MPSFLPFYGFYWIKALTVWLGSGGVLFLVSLIILDIILKYFAAWQAARAGDRVWFAAVLILNTAGILPLVYLIFFSKKPRPGRH